MDEFKINKDFASKYNKYRQKEELQKLKSRYGDVEADDDSSESESEDEKAEAVTPRLERDFLRTLSYLKKKDPAIYDQSKIFYEESDSEEGGSADGNEKTKSSKPMFLKDYERKVILENEGKFIEDESDDEELGHDEREASPTYHQEQAKLQEDIIKAAADLDVEEDKDDGDLLIKRNKTYDEKDKEEEEFRRWLKTPEAKLSFVEDSIEKGKMETVASEIAPLREYWTDPNLEEGEKFLRDYILERKYLDPNDDNEMPTYDEIVASDSEEAGSDDELFEKKAEMFEHKYNFRFEDPDQEFIKTYPRTVGTSVRRKDDKRKKKREELKVKAEDKKRKKEEELKQLKRLKKKEILDKIQQLQEATGNKDLEFEEKDIAEDFDPEEHDKRMQEIFNVYDEDYQEEDEKPVFSDLEEEMDDYERYWDEDQTNQADCEDPDFVMDCDYDESEHQRQKEERKKRKNKISDPKSTEKKAKKSPFFVSVAKPKPAFDPNEKSFEKYLDEYYALDYEDIIGDLPCRFKYRKVVPNDFGLSTDEVLLATDKELNSWCSLKRAVQYRQEDDERRDIQRYKKKARNKWKKARVLKSVYALPGEEEDSEIKKTESNSAPDSGKAKKMNSRKRRRMKERAEKLKLLQDNGDEFPQQPQTKTLTNGSATVHTHTNNTKPELTNNLSKRAGVPSLNTDKNSAGDHVKRKNVKKRKPTTFDKVSKLSDDRLKAYGLEPKKFLRKMRYGKEHAT